MEKPLILTVDDDTTVLASIDRDLRARYAKDYRIIPLNSGNAALEHLKQVQAKNEQVALIMADQRMPNMTGVEFLAQARWLYPVTPRVLLTAYADTEASIDAINQVRLHYYLMKPWNPPDKNLYPVLDDLLAEWRTNFFPPGHRSFTSA